MRGWYGWSFANQRGEIMMNRIEYGGSPITLRRILPYLLILALAIALRARGLDTTQLSSDQSFTLGAAMRWVNGGDMPLAANISSVGFINPPMIIYLYAASLRLWPDVLSVAASTLASGIAAIVVAGWVTYRIFGERVAFWTALLLAINPWSVYYSQLIWNQTMVPLFSTLLLASLLLYFSVEQRPVYLIAGFVWAACMTQVHPGSSPQLLTMGIVFALFWRRLKLLTLFAGIATFLLLYVPFLLFESGVGWRDAIRILELMEQPTRAGVASILVSFDLIHAQGLMPDARGAASFDDLASLLLAFAIIVSLGLGIGAIRKQKRDAGARQSSAAYTILVLWFFVPVLFYLRSSDLVYVQPYYLVGQIPAHFMFIGIAVDWVQGGRIGRFLRKAFGFGPRIANLITWLLVPLPLLTLLAWQILFNIRYQDGRASNLPAETQVRHVRTVIDTGKRLMTEYQDCQLVVVAEGHSVEQSHLSLVREFTFPDRVLLADGRLALPLPNPCAIYLDALPDSAASSWLAAKALEIQDTMGDIPNAAWRFFEVAGDGRTRLAAGARSVANYPQWENGVVLSEYARSELQPGTTLEVTIAWNIVAPAARRLYHVGTYLLTEDNQLVAQNDGPGFDSIQWRQGDAFLTWADLSIPADLTPGTYRVAVAYYSWPEVERVALLSGEDIAFLERIQME